MKIKHILLPLSLAGALTAGVYYSQDLKETGTKVYHTSKQFVQEHNPYHQTEEPTEETKQPIPKASTLEQKLEEKEVSTPSIPLPKQVTSTVYNPPKRYLPNPLPIDATKTAEQTPESKTIKYTLPKEAESIYSNLKTQLQSELDAQKTRIVRKLSQPLYEKLAQDFDTTIAQYLEPENKAKLDYERTISSLDNLSQEALQDIASQSLRRLESSRYNNIVKEKPLDFWLNSLHQIYNVNFATGGQ